MKVEIKSKNSRAPEWNPGDLVWSPSLARLIIVTGHSMKPEEFSGVLIKDANSTCSIYRNDYIKGLYETFAGTLTLKN